MVGLLLRYDYERSSFIRLKEKEVFVDIRIICCTTSLRIEIIVDMPSQHLPGGGINFLAIANFICMPFADVFVLLGEEEYLPLCDAGE